MEKLLLARLGLCSPSQVSRLCIRDLLLPMKSHANNTSREHLYRRHMFPKFRCNRCRQDLKSSARLNEHQRADIICQRQSEEPEEEGIDEEKEKLLRARKRKNGKSRQMGEEGKWVEIYKILFPHDDPVPSPCKLMTRRIQAIGLTYLQILNFVLSNQAEKANTLEPMSWTVSRTSHDENSRDACDLAWKA